MNLTLDLLDIHKHFGSLVALGGVTLRLAGGRVHGLLGENGAGKSTLMNIAYGLLRPDRGEARLNGRPLHLRSPADAIAAGIGMVHQHFMLAGAMTVLDNVLLGDRRASQLLHRRRAAEKLTALADRLGWKVEPFARVERLSVGQQQRIEILKALWRDARMLILDEPTAVLTPPEVEQLFGAVERLRDEGCGVVFISHKLAEVKRICDDLTVLRRGRVVWKGRANDVSPADLARHMIGHDVENVTLQTNLGGTGNAPALPVVREPTPTLELRNVHAPGLHNISLRIAPGQILGIAGVDGNGQQELAEVVVGLRRITSGQVLLNDQDVTRESLKDRLTLGVAHIPNDRRLEALATSMSVTENIALKRHDTRPLSRFGVMSWRTARNVARDLVTRFDVRTPSTQTPVGALSGGNQQKVVLARELAMTDPSLIVAMNPVRGLDVAATNFVYQQLLARRTAGAAILLISSELDELLSLCDRIAVLYEGRLTPTDFPTTSREEIGRLMAGLSPAHAAPEARA
jgi:simple sugar transport system ATP-binding protein